MQDRGAIGRVPYLVPVTWKDGWPMLGVDGKDAITYKKPEVGKTYKIQSPATTDEFSAKLLVCNGSGTTTRTTPSGR